MRTKDQIIEELLKIVEEQKQEIARLKERISELERRLNLNSQNSSKPPSSDEVRKPRIRSLREKGKNKSGGQLNHRGDTLYQTMHPDQIVVHKLDSCPNCKKELREASINNIIKRQIFDISIPKVEVTEHHIEVKNCSKCHHEVSAEFPSGVNAPVQYGPRVKALAIYFQNQHFLPEARLQTIFKDIFELPIAKATLSSFSTALSSRLSDFLELIDNSLYKAKIKHLDETGMRAEGKQRWLHVVSTNELTKYRISRRRGEIPDKMLGIVVHDHWKSYFSIKHARHAICNVHILRELVGIMEEGNESWAKEMYRLLRLSCRVKNQYPSGTPKRWIDFLSRHYFKIVDEGLEYHRRLPPLVQKKKHGTQKRRFGHNLLLRLEYYKDETLRFLYDPNVPFTNNRAEQDLRMMKVKQKISGCFRSFEGAQIFCTVRSFLSTARKQGWNILDAISDALCEKIPAIIAN